MFSSKMLHEITVNDISSLWRHIWSPSVPCLNLIFKIKFYFRHLHTQFPETSLFYTGQFRKRYRLKSVSQKDKSILLRYTSVHSSKLYYIAELVRERWVACDVLSLEARGVKVKDAACAIKCIADQKKKNRGGHCVNGVCVCRK